MTAVRACTWSVQHFRLTTRVTVRNRSRLEEYMSDQRKRKRPITTTDAGIPAPSDDTSLTVGPDGPVLLQDACLNEKLAHFVRERIPDRVYHVKASGAFAYFEVTPHATH